MRVQIYPFTVVSTPFVRYLADFMPTYCVNSVISKSGTGLCGKDVGFADNRGNIGIMVEGEEDCILKENIDLCIIPTMTAETALYADSIAIYIEQALRQNKSVLCSTKISNDIIELYKHNLCFKYISPELNSNELSLLNEIKSNFWSLYMPRAQIIFVGELVNNIGAYEMTLSIASKYKKNGYKVSVIACYPETKILGFHCWPSQLYSNCMEESEKIDLINQYVKLIEVMDRPDAIIIQLPGALAKYNSTLTNGYGIYPYLISQAIHPDFFICCSYFQTITQEYFEALNKMTLYRFGSEISCFAISNTLIDFAESVERKKISKVYLPDIMARTKSREFTNESMPVIYFRNEEELDSMISQMMK